MSPAYFPTQIHFRLWLQENHMKETELIVGFYKVGSGKPSMSWSESVDEALCFGWIDGVRKSIDNESYTIRFTPRRPGSNWSTVNIKKVEELISKGLMQPAGLEIFNSRKPEKTEMYSYENRPERLPLEFESLFMKNKEAWDFFSSQAPSYKKTFIYWVISAKQEATRITRLNKLIDASEKKTKLY